MVENQKNTEHNTYSQKNGTKREENGSRAGEATEEKNGEMLKARGRGVSSKRKLSTDADVRA